MPPIFRAPGGVRRATPLATSSCSTILSILQKTSKAPSSLSLRTRLRIPRPSRGQNRHPARTGLDCTRRGCHRASSFSSGQIARGHAHLEMAPVVSSRTIPQRSRPRLHKKFWRAAKDRGGGAANTRREIKQPLLISNNWTFVIWRMLAWFKSNEDLVSHCLGGLAELRRVAELQ